MYKRTACLCLLLALSLSVVANNTYYVSPSPQHCPTLLTCHTLSYYIENNTFAEPSSTFIFTGGEHILDRHVDIVRVESVAFRALKRWQSIRTVVQCLGEGGLAFVDTATVSISGITFRGCGGGRSAALVFNDMVSVTLHAVTIADSPTRGVAMTGVTYTELRQSSFTGNRQGGMEMNETREIIIEGCSIFGNSVHGEGGGIRIVSTEPSICPLVTLQRTYVVNNTALYGGGLLMRTTCGDLNVSDSHFVDNTAQRLGAGMRLRLRQGTHNITIQHTTIRNNSILGTDQIQYEPPAGGGIYIYISQIHPTTLINILDCTFEDNHGLNYGGAIAINRNRSNDMQYTSYFANTTISRNSFARNTANRGAAITTSFVCSLVIMADNTFIENAHGSTISTGLKTTVCSYTRVVVDRCLFLNNTGIGLHYADYRDYFYHTIQTGVYSYGPSFDVSNSVFDGQSGTAINLYIQNAFIMTNVTIKNTDPAQNNVESADTMYLHCFMSLKLTFYNVLIHDNNGTGVHLKNCQLIYFNGTNTIANNSASRDGGAMALYGTNIIVVPETAALVLINNTAGRYGGAIYATDSPWVKSISFSNWSPCTIYGDDRISFDLNKAGMAGDNIYNGKFFYCRVGTDWGVVPSRDKMLQCQEMPQQWLASNLRSTAPLSMVSSDPVGVCLCDEYGQPNCSTTTVNRAVYSNEPFHITVAVVGYCGGFNAGNVVTVDTPDVSLVSGANNSFVGTKSCKTLTYTPRPTHAITNESMVTANITVTVSGAAIDYPINVSLTVLPCPAGLVMDPASESCVCNDAISHNTPGTKCNVSWMPHPIQHSGNNWIHYYTPLGCTVAHKRCPFDYCTNSVVRFNMTDSDRQCNWNRSGVLCGGCTEGHSLMLGSNRCSQCSNDWLASVALFAACGVLLVFLLMALNLTVSVGSINGLLFYINIIKLNEPIFFPQGNIPVVSQFVAWFNLDWGIEMCFFNGLDGYWKVMLQFAFPLYLWFLMVAIVVACNYSTRLSRLFGRSNAVNVLATLILMSYTKLLQAITKALTVNEVQCGEVSKAVWNVDGNVAYLGYKHGIMFVISLLFLVTGLVYTGLVFSFQWLQRYSSYCCRSTRDPVVKLKPLIDAYTGPYKDRYRFWTGLVLLIRLLLTVLFVFTSDYFPAVNNSIISLSILLVILSTRVYKSRWVMAAEVFSMVNLFLLAVVITPLNIADLSSQLTNAVTTASVSLEMGLFAVIVVVHSILAVRRKFRQQQAYQFAPLMPKKVCKLYGSMRKSSLQDFQESIVEPHREPLIYDN